MAYLQTDDDRNSPPSGLNSEFNLTSLRQNLAHLCARKRMRHSGEWFHEMEPDKRIVLSSSFGVQSALLLSHLDHLDFEIPVVHVDIADSKYDQQRAYRDFLQKELRFNLHVFEAADDADKVRAMDEGLASLNAGLVFSGIRASQTDVRGRKSIAEINGRNGTIEVFPLLDWSDAKLEHYLAQIPEGLRHPAYKPGAQSKGGVLLANGEEKTECGLHNFDWVI